MLGGRTGLCWASSPSLSWAGCGGPGSVAPARGMWEEFVLVIDRVRYHGLLRLAHIRWVCVACAGQVNAFPAGVPDRQALVECVAPSRVVGLYEGVLLGKACSPGVVAVDGRFCSCSFDAPRRVLWREEVIPGQPYRLLPCGWPVRDSRHACAVVRRRCSAGGRLRWAGHACAALGGVGRSRRCCPVCS